MPHRLRRSGRITAWTAEFRPYMAHGLRNSGRITACIAKARLCMPHGLRNPAEGRITLECEKTAKGRKAAPLSTPLGLFYIVRRLWNAERY